jgi:uncharacterized protein YdeI (BOF family)
MCKLQKQIVIVVSIMILIGLSINAYANVYGGQFDESISIDSVRSLNSEKNGQTVTLEGVISAICKGDGCWLNLKDDTGEVMVDLKPYDFRIPKGSSGKKARIQGKVKASDQRVSVDAISIKILE